MLPGAELYIPWLFASIFAYNTEAVDLSVALSYHTLGYDRPEATLDNPIFTVEISKTWGNTTLYVSHKSGLFTTERGYGFNEIGVRYTFKK